MPTPTPLLTPDELLSLAEGANAALPCRRCAALDCRGWEALPGTFDATSLVRVGTLRDPDVDDPTVEEYHPQGTHGWSPDAPIAPAFFPYNRCDVWRCAACGRAFLRYTEYGGYYQEERVRALDPALLVR